MIRTHRRTIVAVASLALVLVVTQVVSAQGRGRGFGRGFTVSQAQLASLEQVQNELKLNAEQKAKVAQVNEEYSRQRSELFQGINQDNREERIQQLTKAAEEATSKVTQALDEAQRERLKQVWIQANGPDTALADDAIAKFLKLSDEQKKQLADAREANRQAGREAFQGFQDLSAEERREKFAEFRRQGDEKLLAVLSAEQKEQFQKMQGEKIEVDLSSLFRRPGGNN